MEPKTVFEERRDGEYRHVSVNLVESGVQLYCQDIGNAAKRLFGDAEYEFWTTVQTKDLAALAFHLLADRYEGRSDAVGEFQKYCAAHDITCEFGSWC